MREDGECLALCLQYITWIDKRAYDMETPHKRKQDIKEIGFKNWWIISYTQSLPADILEKYLIIKHKYIQIYQTKRGTTHAVVEVLWRIIYNPYDIEDLEQKRWIITLTNVKNMD